MRQRAGVILIEEGKVALIERQRAGKHYFVFPGGGIDADESPEQAARREMLEETGLQVGIKQKVMEIHLYENWHYYFLVDKVSGMFGTGTGEEFTASDPDDPNQGTYIPIWMPVAELANHDNVYPEAVAALVVNSIHAGWPEESIIISEESK